MEAEAEPPEAPIGRRSGCFLTDQGRYERNKNAAPGIATNGTRASLLVARTLLFLFVWVGRLGLCWSPKDAITGYTWMVSFLHLAWPSQASQKVVPH